MTKAAQAKAWTLNAWADGSHRSYPEPSGPFPLSVASGGRYLQTAAGEPFLLHGDTPWSIAAQLTDAEITTYLNDRADKGFTAIMFNAIEAFYTSQSPAYENVDGDQPFTTMTDVDSGLVEAYWSRVDHIVDSAKTLGIVCIINPFYLGAGDGWLNQAGSDAEFQAYGAALATRYDQGNVIWCMGGDYAGTTEERNNQWNIVTGIRSVRTTDIITGHNSRGNSAYSAWNGFTGFTLNTAYSNVDDTYSECLAEVANGMPFFLIEAKYEQEGAEAGDLRRQSYQALLSGACGQMFGNNPMWHFESPSAPFSYTGTWQSNLDSVGSTQQQYVKALFAAYDWHLLEPKTDTSLVTTSLGSGTSRICPALASDGGFALIWRPDSGSITVDMTALTPSSVRARYYDATDGTYTTATGSPFTNTGTQNFTFPGEAVLVLDEAV